MSYKGIIYVLEKVDSKGNIMKNNDGKELRYYGSTTKDIEERVQRHLLNYKSYKKGNMNYFSSFEIVKDEIFAYEILETIEATTLIKLRQFLRAREDLYIRTHKCLNMRKESITYKERQQNVKKNAELRKLRSKEKKEIIQLTHNQEIKKEWRKKNIERIHKQDKEYRLKLGMKPRIKKI